MPQLSPTSGLMIFMGVFISLYLLFCLFSMSKTTIKSTSNQKNMIKSMIFF